MEKNRPTVGSDNKTIQKNRPTVGSDNPTIETYIRQYPIIDHVKIWRFGAGSLKNIRLLANYDQTGLL